MDGDMHCVIDITVDADLNFTSTSPLWRETDEHPSGCLVFSRPGKIPKGWYHHITFRLAQDDSGRGLQFPDDPREAFWIVEAKRDHPSPTKQNSDYSVIWPDSTESDLPDGRANLLRVTNKNHDKGAWKFTLNFEGNEGKVAWDPIIQNTNGGVPSWR